MIETPWCVIAEDPGKPLAAYCRRCGASVEIPNNVEVTVVLQFCDRFRAEHAHCEER